MDFSPDEGQQAVADVVNSALGRDNSWTALVDGGVLAFGVPERLGGDGLGLAEVSTALTEIGRHGTTSPALATLGLGVIPLLELASDEQQDRYLAGVAKGRPGRQPCRSVGVIGGGCLVWKTWCTSSRISLL